MGRIFLSGKQSSDQKKAEQRLLELQQSLEEKVEERTQELQQSRTTTEQLIKYAPTGIYEIDFLNMSFKNINEVMINYTGYTKEELLTMNPMDLLTDKSKKIFNERLTKAAQGKHLVDQVEYEIKTKQGELIWTLINVHFIRKQDTITGALVVAHDITERKQKEEIIKENERRLREAEQIGRIGHVEMDVNNKKIFWSKQVYQLYERDPSQGPPSYKEIMKLHDSQDAKQLQSKVKQAIKNGEPYELDLKAILPSGKTRYLHAIGRPVLNAENKVTIIKGTVQDVTDRIVAEQKMNNEKEKFRSILDSMDDGVYIVNDQFEIEYVNPVIEREFGKPKNQLCYEFFHDRDTQCPWCKLDQVQKGNRVQWQWCKPGKEKCYDIVETPIIHTDGRISKMKILRDITDQCKAQEKIQESERLYRSLAANLPGGAVFIVDKDLRCVLAEGEALKHAGFTPSDLEGKKVYEILDEESAVIHETTYKQAFKGKPFRHEHHIHGRHFISHGVPLHDANGEINQVLAISYDITERKEVEKQLKENEEKYRFLYEKSHGFNVIISADGTVQEANQTALNTLGYTKKEVIDKPIHEFIVPRQRKAVADVLKKAVQGKKTSGMDVHLVGKDGTVYTIMFTAGCLNIANIDHTSGYLFTGIDITGRKQAELQLQNIFKNTPDIIARFDQKHRHLFVSPSIKKVTGLSPEQYIGKTNEELGMPKQLCELWNDAIDAVIATGKTVEKEFRFPGSRGEITYSWLIVPEIDSQGAVNSVLGFARDITKMKKYEQEITDLAKFPTQNPHPVIRIKNDGTVLFSNTAGETILKEWQCSVGDVIPNPIKKNLASVVKHGHKKDEEITIENKTFFYTMVPVKQGGYVNLYFLDITDLKQTEQALWESKERYRLAQKAAGIGSWEWDITTGELSWSDNIEEMFKLPKGSFSGTFEAFKNLIHPEDIQQVTEAINECLSSRKTYWVEHRILTSDGSTRWMEESGNVFYDETGKPFRMLGVVQDITRDKQWDALQEQLKNQLQNERDLLKIIMENTDANLAYLDPNFNFIMVNTIYAQQSGYTKKQLIGNNLFDLFPNAENEAIFKQVLDTGKPLDFDSKPFTFPGQTESAYWNWSLIPILGIKNNIQGLVLSLIDVTELQHKQDKISKLNDILMKKTMELAVANKELEAFTYSASHDLQAPLRSISGFSEILLEDYQDCLDTQGKEYLKRVVRSSEKMSQLVQDLLKLSRISRKEMTFSTVNLSNQAKEIINELQQKEPDRQVSVTIEPDLKVQADDNLLRIALTNLLSNAWKFTKQQTKPSITIGTTKRNDETVFYIKDNGAGFNMDQSEKLFVPFQRLHSEKEFEGTGIGLPMVARIIHRHQGNIWAEGKPGKGAIFYFTLPPYTNESEEKTNH